MSNIPDEKPSAVQDSFMHDIIRYFTLACPVVFIWFTGYNKFSFMWFLPLIAIYALRERRNEAKRIKTHIAQEIARDEKSFILARFKDLPSWVNFPDMERVEWINKIVEQLWPFTGNYVEGFLRDSVEDSIKSSLPSTFKSFKFNTIDLGDTPPRIGGIKVYPKLKSDEIYMDLEIIYSSDIDISVSVKSVMAGIKDLRFHGTLRIVMRPLLNCIPIIGGLFIFFLNNPEIDFDLTSFANALDLPGLNKVLHSNIQEQFANMLVLPNCIPIMLAENIDVNKLRFPPPQGVVRIHIVEAKALVDADKGVLGAGKSDPYVIVKVGSQSGRTKVIDNTLTPVWNETFEMIVDLADGQVLNLEVFDEDPGDDDFLGRVNMRFVKLRDSGFQDVWLPLRDTKSGLLHVKLTWLWLADDPLELELVLKKIQKDKNNSAILMVFLDSAEDLPKSIKGSKDPSPKAILSVSEQKQESAVKANTTKPIWQQNFRFMMLNPKFQSLKLEIEDTKVKKSIGETILKIKDLLTAPDMTIDQTISLKTTEAVFYVHIQMSLRILTPNARPEI